MDSGNIKVGFIGLGVMGAPMAGHLLAHGFDLTVWNRTAEKAEPLHAAGAKIATSPEQLAASCDVICLCLNRTQDVAEIVARLLPHLAPNRLIIDHSTIEPSGAVEIASQCQESGQRFLDAPVTGGSMGAINGTLTIFCGGSEPDFAEAMPVLQSYGRKVAYIGPSGQGQRMKMANQIAVGGALLALCESMAFAQACGLDLAQTRELLSSGAAGSWALENYGPKILNRDWSPGFSIKNQRKDFEYCFSAARDCSIDLPGTQLVDQLLAQLESQGRGEDTTAALFDILCNNHPK